MLSCGEASGDLYAGALVRAMRELAPGLEAFGLGGPSLAAAGADLVADYRGISVTGLVEALSVLRRSWALLGALEAAARDRKPDVFVAIDFPDFNFRLLPRLHALGIPIVYYVSPQLWAWRPGRIKTILRYVRKMLVLFPFETAIYERAGVPVEFVGHPLIDLIATSGTRADWLAAHGLDAARPIVALLPGSRPNEVARILPELTAGAQLIRDRIPGVQFVVARAPGLDDTLFAPLDALGDRGARGTAVVVDGHADDVLEAADVVVTASGTATVQTALHDRPMVMVYRLSPMTYRIGRSFVRVRQYAMVNLVAGRSIVPELVQDGFTAEAVARETVSLLTDRTRADAMRRDLAQVRDALGAPGASRRAAKAVLGVG